MPKPDFKALSDSIIDRTELEDALRSVYEEGVRDEASRWWIDFDASKHTTQEFVGVKGD